MKGTSTLSRGTAKEEGFAAQEAALRPGGALDVQRTPAAQAGLPSTGGGGGGGAPAQLFSAPVQCLVEEGATLVNDDGGAVFIDDGDGGGTFVTQIDPALNPGPERLPPLRSGPDRPAR